MSLQEILKLMEQKYPGDGTALLIYSDESGRITSNPEEPYNGGVLLEFDSIEVLVLHLQEK